MVRFLVIEVDMNKTTLLWLCFGGSIEKYAGLHD